MKDKLFGGGVPKKNAPLINDRIRASQLQLISSEGENLGVVSREEALRQAVLVGLDLVIIADRGPDKPPIAKIMDFGKAEFEKKKKLIAAKKKQKVIKVKEIKLRPKISEHDFQTKLKQAAQFLKDGMRLKVTLLFRGRERAQGRERGEQMYEKVLKTLDEYEVKNVVQDREGGNGEPWSRIFYVKES